MRSPNAPGNPAFEHIFQNATAGRIQANRHVGSITRISNGPGVQNAKIFIIHLLLHGYGVVLGRYRACLPSVYTPAQQGGECLRSSKLIYTQQAEYFQGQKAYFPHFPPAKHGTNRFDGGQILESNRVKAHCDSTSVATIRQATHLASTISVTRNFRSYWLK